ncbi:uncharacterized protein TRUGW13939_00738 [Talaromyces rugulosus]|uniref:Uncharacterized protein n=1 Tax=Talaromyces rugulosus TaxID=121627 RepID=A0A7H8QI48_TALRU|nr:uncharacterized protein TRUGW13939_00738 [Talaromyces rugulosus]QKX53659.1 hypothetical protein TRUGW13939_00738 [Talaromyces rugulosus]
MSLSRSCRTARVQARSFSVSSKLRVGPESPNYIEIPRTLQPDLPSKPKVKGTLPVPREIFPPRRADKPTWTYITAATLEPKENPVKADGPHAEAIEWKNKMAELRRANLREGLVELYQRKLNTDAFMTRRSAAKQARRQRVFDQPPREDERLTRPTVVKAMEPTQGTVLSDPNREKRITVSRQRVLAKQRVKSEIRQEDLHTLYMNARTFITTEAQLDKEIETKFSEDGGREWDSDSGAGNNVWAKGAPPSIQDIVRNQTTSDAGRWRVEQERMRKVVEELTGGKI